MRSLRQMRAARSGVREQLGDGRASALRAPLGVDEPGDGTTRRVELRADAAHPPTGREHLTGPPADHVDPVAVARREQPAGGLAPTADLVRDDGGSGQGIGQAVEEHDRQLGDRGRQLHALGGEAAVHQPVDLPVEHAAHQVVLDGAAAVGLGDHQQPVVGERGAYAPRTISPAYGSAAIASDTSPTMRLVCERRLRAARLGR